jgi:Na+/glutamate symporter
MYIIPGGFGTGITQSTTFVQLTAGVKSSEMAMAAASLYLSQNLGMVSGLSVTTSVLQSTLRSGLAKSLHEVPHRHEVSRVGYHKNVPS